MKCEEIIRNLEGMAPVKMAESWDNVGLLAGRRDKEVNKVFLCVDVTKKNIQKALDEKADMIISHHPLIFKPVNRVNDEDFIGMKLLTILQNDISYYAMHTNFDIMGMSEAVAKRLGMRDTEILEMTYEDEISQEGEGRIGPLPEILSLKEWGERIKEIFRISHVRIYGDPGQLIETAAVVPGSGKSYIDVALKKGADAIITGDVDHHSGLDAIEKGIFVIDAGHFGLEKIFTEYMRDFLTREIPQIEVVLSGEKEPYWVL